MKAERKGQPHAEGRKVLEGGGGIPRHEDSVDAMLSEARAQGWLQDSMGRIPELVTLYKNAADDFMGLVRESEPDGRQTLMFHICRYLFGKAVEGVILWGAAPHGNISVYFHPKHLVGEVETEVPVHLHKVVIDSMSIGETLFRAHQAFVIQSQKEGIGIDLEDEMAKTLQWIPRLGVSYALHRKFNLLG
jgi:hypothetical protein